MLTTRWRSSGQLICDQSFEGLATDSSVLCCLYYIKCFESVKRRTKIATYFVLGIGGISLINRGCNSSTEPAVTHVSIPCFQTRSVFLKVPADTI